MLMTMKKIYINPEMDIVMIQTQQMLAASLSVDSEATPIDPSGADSREFPIWLLDE